MTDKDKDLFLDEEDEKQPKEVTEFDYFGGDSEADGVELEDEKLGVASPAGRNILAIIILGLAALFLLYYMIFKEDEEEKRAKAAQELLDSQPAEQAQKLVTDTQLTTDEIASIDAPDLPDLGAVDLPSLSAENSGNSNFIDPFQDIDLTPITPTAPTEQVEDIVIEEPEPQQKEEEPLSPIQAILPEPEDLGQEVAEEPVNNARSGPMLLINGGNTNPQDFSGFAKSRTSGAATQEATFVGNTDLMIVQGKMIFAVLETAINTDLPGALRAVVSRDIYAESGRHILIPKGSRLIGTYGSGVQFGQRRVLISWTRIIRPDGIDIQVGSPGTDQLGRAGTSGLVDNKYFDIFSNSILTSAFTVGAAVLFDQVQDSQTVTSTTSTGINGGTSSSTSGNTTDQAVLSAVQNVGNVATRAFGLDREDGTNVPTIMVDQGTRLNVFVNKDLIFPDDIIDQVNFIR